jgi:hypothetical protein
VQLSPSAKFLGPSARSHISIPRSKEGSARSSACSRRPSRRRIIQRDRHAELLTTIAITGASLEKFAVEVRGLQKTEIGEVQEPFGKGQKGLVGDAAQAQPDRLRADHRSGAAVTR